MSVKTLIRLAAVLLGLYASSAMSAVLYVDISGRGTQNSTWVSDLTSLGYSVTSVTYARGADITASLTGYSTVIVSNGDADTNNLSVNTVNKLITYLNSGGSLLYAGGHSLYSEANAATLASTYFGVGNYTYNMPSFTSSSATATSGATTYNMSTWAGGYYGNMLTAFSVLTGTTSDMILGTGWGGVNSGASSIAASHVTATYGAAVWGFDIDQISTTAQQKAFLAQTLNKINHSTAPEPDSRALVLFAAAMGLALSRTKTFGSRFRKQ